MAAVPKILRYPQSHTWENDSLSSPQAPYSYEEPVKRRRILRIPYGSWQPTAPLCSPENAGRRLLPYGKSWDISAISSVADILFPVDSIPAPVPQISAPFDWSGLWSGRILAGAVRISAYIHPRWTSGAVPWSYAYRAAVWDRGRDKNLLALIPFLKRAYWRMWAGWNHCCHLSEWH